MMMNGCLGNMHKHVHIERKNNTHHQTNICTRKKMTITATRETVIIQVCSEMFEKKELLNLKFFRNENSKSFFFEKNFHYIDTLNEHYEFHQSIDQ